jgi:hypothetical protein
MDMAYLSLVEATCRPRALHEISAIWSTTVCALVPTFTLVGVVRAMDILMADSQCELTGYS